MHHRVFAGLKHTTFPPLKKFPQLVLSPGSNFQLSIPFAELSSDEASLLTTPPTAEVEEMSPIVEIRSSDKRRLLGLGFVDARNASVACFHITRPSAMLPVVDNQFFSDKLSSTFQRRRTVLPSETTAYRGVHEVHDLFPFLEIDHFCSSFSRIRCSSVVAERLLPLAADFLQERGAEQLLISTPSIPSYRLSLVKSSLPDAKPYYQEDSIQYLWEGHHEHNASEDVGANSRWYLNLAFRRARLMVRNIASGKKCLCVGDTAAGMALNACLHAEHVCIVEENAGYRNWVRQIVGLNHGTRIFDSKISLYSSLHSVVGGDSPAPPRALFDVITLEVTIVVDDELLQKVMRVAAAGAMVVVQFTGNATEALLLQRSLGRTALLQGRSAYEVNKLSSSSIDFPRHALARPADAQTSHNTVFTFLID
jgi:hypothetical protein